VKLRLIFQLANEAYLPKNKNNPIKEFVMSPTTNSKCTLEKMNNAISNPTLAAVTSIAIILGVISLSGIMENPQKITEIVELIQHKVHVGSVINVDYSYK
jgi:hypothetical protein